MDVGGKDNFVRERLRDPAMTAERLRPPDLAAAFDRRFALARRERMRRLLRRATGRRGRNAGLADRVVAQLLGPEPPARTACGT